MKIVWKRVSFNRIDHKIISSILFIDMSLVIQEESQTKYILRPVPVGVIRAD